MAGDVLGLEAKIKQDFARSHGTAIILPQLRLLRPR